MDVTDEEQAAMAIKLAENVRQLIRAEVKAALEDWSFCSSFHKGPLADVIMREVSVNTMLQSLLAQIVAQKLMR